jgi:hypothetical protein
MSLKEPEMQILSIFGAAALTAGLFVPMLWFTDKAEAQGSQLKDMLAIEATIAFKKTPNKQPQKITQPKPTIEKPEGVSHDENKKPDEKKPEKKPEDAKIDPKNPFGKFDRTKDQDEGKPTTEPGDFNGSDKGFAPTSKGDPFFGRLRADMNFQFPEIAKASSIPVGCLHIQADGQIEKTTFDPPIGQKGDDDLQTAAEAAMRELVKARRANPEPVPTHLLGITTKWLCFKFSVQD